MGKYKIPSVQYFLSKKTIYGDKKDPVWVYLEREMRENIGNKQYNEKVGAWLRYLKELKYYFYCEAKRKKRRLNNEVGPPWYIELSSCQREVLDDLKSSIHQDLLEDLPNRIRKSLSDLGVTLKLPKRILMQAMNDSVEDPGIFIWNLYKAVYKTSPSELRSKYDMNAMILMSCLVFIDLEECIQELESLTQVKIAPPPVPKESVNKYYQPKIRYGEYLQKMYVPFYSSTPSDAKKNRKPSPLAYKFRVRSQESYERLCKDYTFMVKRKERNKKEKQTERVCTYKFWEPPNALRNSDPKKSSIAVKQRMIRQKAKVKHKSHFKNIQYHVGGVAFTGGTPVYILNNMALLPTGYMIIHGGTVHYNGENITCIQGFWKYPREIKVQCEETCDCVYKWENVVMDYLKDSKCKCGHLYDYYNEGKVKDKFFHPPTKHSPFWVDNAKVFQNDPMEDFIKDSVRDALMSVEPTPEPSVPTILPSSLSEKDLLAALLADLSDTPLLIPHLPEAELLNNLQEWVRKRINGQINPKDHRKLILQSQRRWLDLKHMDFRARAFRIPFTLKQLEHMNWSYRLEIQKLFYILLNNFVSRNRLKQVEQSRLWWSTTKYDTYPSKAFLDIFFTYMPPRMKDTFLINPYSSELTPKYGAKTCPL